MRCLWHNHHIYLILYQTLIFIIIIMFASHLWHRSKVLPGQFMWYCPVVQLTTTGTCPSGWTQTPHLYVLQLWGYKPVTHTPTSVVWNNALVRYIPYTVRCINYNLQHLYSYGNVHNLIHIILCWYFSISHRVTHAPPQRIKHNNNQWCSFFYK